MVDVPQQNQAQLSYEIAVYREQMTMLKRETERVSLTALDLNNAIKSVENLNSGKVLIQVGGGALVHASISGTNVLVPIGSGYLMEMKKEVATLELTKRISATNKAVERLTEEFNKLNERLRELSVRLRQIETESKLNQQVDENIKDDYL